MPDCAWHHGLRATVSAADLPVNAPSATASAMERHREMQADVVSVLHIAPRSNMDLMDAALAAELAPDCECSVPAVWSGFAMPGRLHHVATEDLIPVLARAEPKSDWAAYVGKRYADVGAYGQ